MVLGACGGHVRGNCWACGTHNAARASPLDAAQPLDCRYADGTHNAVTPRRTRRRQRATPTTNRSRR